MSNKQRNAIPPIDLNDAAFEHLNKMMDVKKVSQANYINECILFAKRVREQLKTCPNSYIGLNVDESEVNLIRTEGI